jgi:LysR family transcriptional regulator, transcriptional activator for bauABCD operon
LKKPDVLGQLADIDIRLLRVFHAVAQAGGFSAAEMELNIGRSTISRHIKDLEIRLGMTLCIRGRAGFSITDEGQRVYEASLRLISSINEFRTEINEVHRKMTGKLVIALYDKTATNPNCKIYKAIAQFDKLAPSVNIELFVKSLNDIDRGVMDGTYHIGVAPQHRASASLDYFSLFDEPMHLYCGQGHPLYTQPDSNISKKDILHEKYVGLGYHSPNMERGRELGMTRAATAYDQEGVVTLLLSGSYIGYLPAHYASNFVDKGLIRAIATKTFQYNCEFFATCRHSPKPNRIVASFLESILSVHKK